MHNRSAITLLVAAALIGVAAGTCHGAIAREISWKQVSDNGRFVLVMVSSKSVDEDASNLDEPKAAAVRAIRAVYTLSGMYRNDGSTTPLWTIPYHSSGGCFIAPDGDHVAFHGYHFYTNVWFFYFKGQLLAVHKEADVLPSFRVRNAIHRHELYVDCVMDADALTLTAYSDDRTELIFDMRTGAVISRPWDWRFLALLGLVLVAVLTVAGVVLVRRRRVALMIRLHKQRGQ